MECIANNSSGFECTWKRVVSASSIFLMYATIIPVLAVFGFVASSLNAIVFMRPKMKPSVFTYLTILSWVDSLSCMVILFICISRTICLNSFFWTYFDLQLQSALFGTLSGSANWILAALTMDRIIYLRHRLPQTPPKFCTRLVARRNVCGIILMSAILNSPYYFMYIIENDGSFYATNFYKSNIYKMHNWFAFTTLCIIPGIFLLIGNTAVFIIFRRWVSKSKSLSNPHRIGNNPVTRNRQELQFNLTITVIILVFLYIFGELPSQITSKRNAINLLFGGDISKIDFEKVEKFECGLLTLNALQLNFNIIVYAVINPSFMAEFFVFLGEITNFIFFIFGCNAFRKCWKKKRNRCQTDGDFDDPSSISYHSEIFTIEEEYGKSVMLEMENIDMSKTYVYRRTKSGLDLRLLGIDSEDWLRCGRILQRHSLPF